MGLFRYILGGESRRNLKRLDKLAETVLSLDAKYSKFTDEELKEQTDFLRGRLKAGETLDDILCDAFAVVREASTRVLGLRHFHVQLIGGVVLHQGRIAEMRTGEGKTLTATTAVYLNALTGKNVHVITVNEYLATYHLRGGCLSSRISGACGARVYRDGKAARAYGV